VTGEVGAAFEFDVVRTAELGEPALARVLALFHAAYRAANDVYFEKALATLRFVAMARSSGDLAGFALGEMRTMDLPRLPAQAVALAGICCVDPRFRRSGLFIELERRAFVASGVPAGPRLLSCGRVAHPASFRTIRWNPSHVPRRGVPPTPWQREVGAAIARAYDVERFDPDTFVCAGSGAPIGYPIMEMDVTPEEWELFATVDRDRGDSLLGLCWTPDAPEGW
jgi:hypothetical protein